MINLDAVDVHVNQGLGYLREIASLNVGQEAPPFQAETIQGEKLSLADQEGKIVILEFWATWCGPCKPEIPHLKSIDETYPNEKVQVIGISLDKDLTKLGEFIAKEEMKWPQIIQPEEWNGVIAEKYNVSGIPRSYIIGPDGKILAKDVRGKDLEDKIAELVSE